MVRDLKGTREREEADLGLMVCMEEPSEEMRREASTAGLITTPRAEIPRIQIFSVHELLESERRPIAAPVYNALQSAEARRRRGPRPRKADRAQREIFYPIPGGVAPERAFSDVVRDERAVAEGEVPDWPIRYRSIA